MNIIILHKANNTEQIRIDILDLANGNDNDVFTQEGKGLAKTLWEVLPNKTIDTLSDELIRLRNKWLAEINELGL